MRAKRNTIDEGLSLRKSKKILKICGLALLLSSDSNAQTAARKANLNSHRTQHQRLILQCRAGAAASRPREQRRSRLSFLAFTDSEPAMLEVLNDLDVEEYQPSPATSPVRGAVQKNSNLHTRDVEDYGDLDSFVADDSTEDFTGTLRVRKRIASARIPALLEPETIQDRDDSDGGYVVAVRDVAESGGPAALATETTVRRAMTLVLGSMGVIGKWCILPPLRLVGALTTSGFTINSAVAAFAAAGILGAFQNERRATRKTARQANSAQDQYVEELKQKNLALDAERGRIEASLKRRIIAMRAKVIKTAEERISAVESKAQKLAANAAAAEVRIKRAEAVVEHIKAEVKAENEAREGMLARAQESVEVSSRQAEEAEAKAEALAKKLQDAIATQAKHELKYAHAPAGAKMAQDAVQRTRLQQLKKEHQGAIEILRAQHNAELRRLQTVIKNALQSRRVVAVTEPRRK